MESDSSPKYELTPDYLAYMVARETSRHIKWWFLTAVLSIYLGCAIGNSLFYFFTLRPTSIDQPADAQQNQTDDDADNDVKPNTVLPTTLGRLGSGRWRGIDGQIPADE